VLVVGGGGPGGKGGGTDGVDSSAGAGTAAKYAALDRWATQLTSLHSVISGKLQA
jgi:hypothetical protein